MLVADKDKVLSVDAVGFADIAAKLAMRADDVFWIASESKPITAAGLMMLVDDGKVQLDHPVENSDRQRQPMPTGGLLSTADAFARFCQMMLNKGVATCHLPLGGLGISWRAASSSSNSVTRAIRS
jgi:CubicO group peptidase (beta-lactamase class C family)